MLSIGLQNFLSLTMIPFLLYIQSGVTFPSVALDKITSPKYLVVSLTGHSCCKELEQDQHQLCTFKS